MILSIKSSNPTNSSRNNLHVIDALARSFVSARTRSDGIAVENSIARERNMRRDATNLEIVQGLLSDPHFLSSGTLGALDRARFADTNSGTFITRINERFIMISVVSQTGRIERWINISGGRGSHTIYAILHTTCLISSLFILCNVLRIYLRL